MEWDRRDRTVRGAEQETLLVFFDRMNRIDMILIYLVNPV